MSRRIKIGQLQSFHCGLISGGCDGSEIFICHAKYGTPYHLKGRLGLVATLTRTTPIFMGRRAKHLTQAAKACARREIDRKYSQSESAKTVRAASKRALYIHNTGRHNHPRPLHCIPHLPALPYQIHNLYHAPLSESEILYQDFLAGNPDFLSHNQIVNLADNLQRWMEKPPFRPDTNETDSYFRMDMDKTDPHSFHYFTECLGQIIDGTRMRQQKEDDRRRRVDLTQMGWSAFIDALRVEVMQLLADWEALDIEMYDSYHASRPYKMHQNYLHWQARTIYHLYYLQFLE
ncbi:hypothetical protein B0H14DRAFT_2570715 [Mycena olivaceomarginata]|nr:hypothetical protein B0H14DRAFT_2570715 [Mycena olivaceomarginata]